MTYKALNTYAGKYSVELYVRDVPNARAVRRTLYDGFAAADARFRELPYPAHCGSIHELLREDGGRGEQSSDEQWDWCAHDPR